MRPIWVIIRQEAIGGAEKRMMGTWLRLRRIGLPMRLITTNRFAAIAESVNELAELREDRRGVETHTIEAIDRRLVSCARESCVMHFVLLPPYFLRGRSRAKVLYTIPNSSLNQYGPRGLLNVIRGIIKCDMVDILDPFVFAAIRKYIPFVRTKLRQTPGSYIAIPELPLAGDWACRPMEAVFCSLFTREKGFFRLAQVLPEYVSLVRKRFPAFRVRLLGRGDETAVSLARKLVMGGGGAVEFEWSANPESYYRQARIVLSLQRTTNYPSKSLLEGMAFGAIPIVTDSRGSEEIAPREMCEYVPKEFDAAQIATATTQILGLTSHEAESRRVKIRELLTRRFSPMAHDQYYHQLYSCLGA